MAHHQAGRLEEARAVYLHVLSIEPLNAEILHLLGVVACQLGDRQNGIAYLSRAVSIKPGFAEAQCNYGQALLDVGRVPEALAAFDRALSVKKDFGEAHDKRGMALQRLGRFSDALGDHSRACALMPHAATAWSNLGAAYLGLKRFSDAELACRRALGLSPTLAIAHNNLGLVLAGMGLIEEAQAALRQSADLDHNSDALYNLGCVFYEAGRLLDAVGALRAATAAQPGHSSAYSNLGNALRGLNRIDEAEAVYRQALSLNPTSAETHFNLSLALLVSGRLVPGWEEYEWRWKMDAASSVGLQRQGPQWFGQPLQGQTVLIHAEQGLGDTIQFIRYLPQVAALGAKVALEVQAELMPLLKGFPGVSQLIERGQFCNYDLHCPLLSLPRVFGTSLNTIPADVPYIWADPRRVEDWRARLEPHSCPRIGFVWAGSAEHHNDRNRSLIVDALAPLLGRGDFACFSLQKGSAAGSVKPEMIDLAPELTDFAETAAALAHLDLIITVDTSVAHLAGAMGKPAWVLLPFSPDWRWLLDRGDSAWYPTLRLFRQSRPGDWDGVIGRISAELDGVDLKDCGAAAQSRQGNTLVGSVSV